MKVFTLSFLRHRSPFPFAHLDFRDYLKAAPYVAEQYTTLKLKLAQQFPHDIFTYMDGKDAFIRETIEKAHTWPAKEVIGD